MDNDLLIKRQISKHSILIAVMGVIFIVLSYVYIDPFKEMIKAVIMIGFMHYIAGINFKTDIISDKFNLIFGIVGIVVNIITENVNMMSMIGGLLIGGGGLYLIAVAYELVTEKEGLGGGVIKYVAAMGLWLGHKYIPIAVIIGLLIMLIVLNMFNKRNISTSIPGDMFFSFGAIIVLLFGDKIFNVLYLLR